MKSFNEWIKENNPGNYVSIGVELLPTESLNGIDGTITPEPHITLMYSKGSAVPLNQVQNILDKSNIKNSEATVTGLNVFSDKENVGKSALVLELDHPELHKLHDQLSATGCKHSFIPYVPHATLAYGVPTDDAYELASKLKESLVGSKLKLTDYTNAPVKEDWVEKTK